MCRIYTSILSTSITYYQVCKKSNTTVPLLDQELVILQDDVRLLSDFSGCSLCSIFSFLITALFFLFFIALSALRFTASDYPYRIFKRFFTLKSGGKREPLNCY